MKNFNFPFTLNLGSLNKEQLKALYTMLTSDFEHPNYSAINTVGHYIQDAYDLTDGEMESLKPHYTFGIIDDNGMPHTYGSYKEARKQYHTTPNNRELYYTDGLGMVHTIRRNYHRAI